MAKHLTTMKRIKTEFSIQLEEGMLVFDQNSGAEKELLLENLIKNFDYRYNFNSRYVCFVDERNVYLSLNSPKILDTLEDHRIKQDNFMMPLSESETLKYQQSRVSFMAERIADAEKQDFIKDCIAFSKVNGIFSVNSKTLNKCFEIPDEGIDVVRDGAIITYWPYISCRHSVDDIEFIGKYCAHNGKVIFVNRDGRTYIAKGYGIIYELEKSGFHLKKMFVPLSYNETILDDSLDKAWSSIEVLKQVSYQL